MTTKMISVSEAYFRSIGALDREKYLDCFAADATLSDPYGGRVFSGQDALARWFSGMERTWSTFSMKPDSRFVSGDKIAVKWSAEATAKNGKLVRFEGINVFTVDEDGLISRLEGYWDAASMMAQIS